MTDGMSDIVMLRVTIISYRHTSPIALYRHRQLRIVEALRIYFNLVNF